MTETHSLLILKSKMANGAEILNEKIAILSRGSSDCATVWRVVASQLSGSRL